MRQWNLGNLLDGGDSLVATMDAVSPPIDRDVDVRPLLRVLVMTGRLVLGFRGMRAMLFVHVFDPFGRATLGMPAWRSRAFVASPACWAIRYTHPIPDLQEVSGGLAV